MALRDPADGAPLKRSAPVGATRDEPDFRALFEALPSLYLLVAADRPRYTIVAASDAYLHATHTTRDGDASIIGRSLFDAFPDPPDDPTATGSRNLLASLDRATSSGRPDAMPVQRYAIRAPDGSWENRYWNPLNTPIVNAGSGRVTHVVHRVVDVTESVRLAKAHESLRGEHVESERRRAGAERAHTELSREHEALEHANQQLQDQAAELEMQSAELYSATLALEQRAQEAEAATRRALFSGDLGRAITEGGSLPDMMRRCCQAAVDHLDAAFCRVWVLDRETQSLVLAASAGLYTHLDGPHGRVPMGQFKIGQIASERRAHVTNAVVGDIRVNDQEWARRTGMIAFAGHPLVVGDELLGVFAMFARHKLDDADLAAVGTGATAIAVAVNNDRLLVSERHARAMAEEANTAKSHFLTTMSHELRTPLNAIGGYAELMEMGIRGPVTPQQRADLARIHASQRHLLGLINEVLNYAKLGSGSVKFDVMDVPVDEAFREAHGLVAPQAGVKQIALIADSCDSAVAVRADPEKLRQVLVNLLSNALKFTEPGGRIALACEARGDRVRIVVTDSGIGIAADKLEEIFEPFVQVRASLTRTAEGTGLGLAISRHLARGMGGDLTAESAEGAGSSFTLVLPRA